MERVSGEITRLLADLQAGNKQAESRLAPLIYKRLHRMADGYMRGERPDHTLQPTALLNEAYMQLVARAKSWHDSSHFFTVASQVMRRILVDYARSRSRGKRGGLLMKVELRRVREAAEDQTERLLRLEAALARLTELDPRLARIVEMRFYAGLTELEAAEALGISTRTVKRDWIMAKAWLYYELGR